MEMTYERPGLARSLSDVTQSTSEDYPLAFEHLKDRCSGLTNEILGILSYDSISCPQEIKVSSFRNKATVGLLLIDSVVNEMAFGGPAYNSGILKRGDRIVRVDGNIVTTAEEIESALVKNDFPGATVALTIQRGNSEDAGQELEMVLTKMDATFIADRCQIMHSFAHLKEHLIQENNALAVEMLDSFMDMITQMIVASSNHSERTAAAMQALILKGATAVHELQKVLNVTFGLCQGTLESSQPLAGSHSDFSSSACSGRQRSADTSDVSGSSTDDDADMAPRHRLGQGPDPVLYHLKGRSPPVPRLMLEAITAGQTHPATQPITPAPLLGHVPLTAPATAPVSSPVDLDLLSLPGSAGPCSVRCEHASRSGSASPTEGAGLGRGGVQPAGLFRQADEGHGWELAAFTPERVASAQDVLWFDTDRLELDVSDLSVVLSESDAAVAARLTRMAAENSVLKTRVEHLQRSLTNSLVSSDALHLILAQACQMKAVIAGISVQLELETDNLRQEIEALENCLDETLQWKLSIDVDVKATAPPLDNKTRCQVECLQERVGKKFLHALSQEMEWTDKVNGSAKAGCLMQQNIECGSLLPREDLPELAAKTRAEAKDEFAVGDADTPQTMVEDLLEKPEGLILDVATEDSKWKVGLRDRLASLKHRRDQNHLTICDENWDETMKEVEWQVSSSQQTLDDLHILLTNIFLRLHPVALAKNNQTADNVVTVLLTASPFRAKTNSLLTAGGESLPMGLSESMAFGTSYEGTVLQQCKDSEEQSNLPVTLDHIELQESVRFVMTKKSLCAPMVHGPKAKTGPAPREESYQIKLEGMVESLDLERSIWKADIDIEETQVCTGIMQIQSRLTEIRLLQEHLNHMVPKHQDELDKAVRAAETLRVENEQLLKAGNGLVVAEELMTVKDALGANKIKTEVLHAGNMVSKAELDCAKEQVMMLTNMVAQLRVQVEIRDSVCKAESAAPNHQIEMRSSGGRELVPWQESWDETFEEVMMQVTANEQTIELVNQRVGDMLWDLYISAVEIERVEAIISDRVLVPAAVIQMLKGDIEIKDAQLYHMTTQIQDGQRTVEKLLEDMNNMVPKCELAEAAGEVDRLRFELEHLGQQGQLSAQALGRRDVGVECIEHVRVSTTYETQSKLRGAQVEGADAATLKYIGGEMHQQLHEKMIQKMSESEMGSQLMRTEILPACDETLFLEENVPRKYELTLMQELCWAEIQAMEKIVCASQEAILNLQSCICNMVPRRNLLAAEEVIKRLEAMVAANVHLPTEVLLLKSEIISKDTQLCNMTLQAQASSTLILGLHGQRNKIVPEGELLKIYRDFDVLIAEVERLQGNAMGLVAVDALESVQDSLQAKTSEIERLHAIIRKSARHEELAGAKKQVLMLTESVSLLKLQLQEAAAKAAEKEMLLATMNCTETAAKTNPIGEENVHCKGEMERMKLIIAEVWAVLWPCLELCLADVDWLLQQTESVIKIDSESILVDPMESDLLQELNQELVDPLESDSLQELNQKELSGCAETMHIDLSWGCRSSRFCASVLAVVLFFVSLRFDAPVIVVV